MISDCRERGRVMVSIVASQEGSLRFVPAGDRGVSVWYLYVFAVPAWVLSRVQRHAC